MATQEDSDKAMQAEMQAQIESLQEELEKIRNPEQKGESILCEALKGAQINMPPTTALKLRRSLLGHFGKVYCLAWSATGKNIVSAAQDGKLIVWNAMYQHKLYVVTLNSSWVMTCGYSPDGIHVASGGLDNNCTVYQLGDRKYVQSAVLRGHDGYLSSCKFKSKDQVITSSGDKTCILWNLAEGRSRMERKFVGHKSDVTATAIDSSSSNLFVSGSGDQTAKLWDVRQDDCVMTFRDSKSDVNCADFMNGGNAFATGAEDGKTRIYDVRTYRTIASFTVGEGHTSSTSRQHNGGPRGPLNCTAVAFSKTGRFIFSGYDDGNCRVWNTLCGDPKNYKDACVDVLGGHMSRVSCVAVEPEEGKALATADWGKQWEAHVRIWA